MSILVGYPPNHRGQAVLHLGAMLARSAQEDLVVCTVVPARWTPGMSRADAEYQDHLERLAASAIQQARAELPADVTAEFTTRRARSTSRGLLELAEQRGATMIALGSSTAGMVGRVMLSSVGDRLLHSSPVPVALATRGFNSGPGESVTRVTVSYGGSDQSDQLVGAARKVAANVGVPLRLAAFAVQPRPPDTAMMGVESAAIMSQWTANVRAAGERALQADTGAPSPSRLEVVIGRGYDWAEALGDVDWEPHEVLLVGSSSSGPVARVFLGSRAAKIVRHCPVPVILVPRVAAKNALDS